MNFWRFLKIFKKFQIFKRFLRFYKKVKYPKFLQMPNESVVETNIHEKANYPMKKRQTLPSYHNFWPLPGLPCGRQKVGKSICFGFWEGIFSTERCAKVMSFLWKIKVMIFQPPIIGNNYLITCKFFWVKFKFIYKTTHNSPIYNECQTQ